MLQATRIPNSGSKRLLAGIWPKRVVSQGSQNAALKFNSHCAKLSAPHNRNGPCQTPWFGPKRVLVVYSSSPKGTMPSYLRPGTGVAHAKPNGLRSGGFWQCFGDRHVTTWRRPSKKESPPREGVWGGENPKPVKGVSLGGLGWAPVTRTAPPPFAK